MRTMAKRKNKIRTQEQITKVGYGSEPTWEGKIDDAELHLVRCLNWYNYCASASEEKRWLIEWAKKHLSVADANRVSKLESKACVHLGRLARIQTLGCSLELRYHNGAKMVPFKEAVDSKIKRVKVTDKAATPNRKSVQDYIRENYERISGDLHHEIDQQLSLVLSGKKTTFKFEEWVKANDIATIYMKKINAEFKPMLAEFKLAASKKDKQLTEAYAYLKAVGLKKMIALLTDIVEGTKIVAKNKPKRVYRKRKPKDKTKVVSKVRFLPEDKTLGIRSQSPTKILESKMIVVYNTKYNTIEVYEASTGTLSVKGARIVNYDPAKTYKQRIRKPKDLIKKINGKGIRAFKNAMKEIKTKQTVPSGLIGASGVILLSFA